MRPRNGWVFKGRTGYMLARALYGAGGRVLAAGARILYGSVRRPPEKIAIFRTGNLGDAFCSIPAIRAVRAKYPRARYVLLTAEKQPDSPHPVDVLCGILPFDGYILFNPAELRTPRYLLRLIRRLRSEKIDLLVYLGFSVRFFQIFRDLVFYRLAGCKIAVGFSWAWHGFFRLAQAKFGTFDNEVRRLMKILQPLGIDPEEINWAIPSPPVPLFLPDRGNRPRIAIHPGAKFPVNRWPGEKFNRLITLLQKEFDPQLILVGGVGAGQDTATPRIGRRLAPVVDLRGKTGYLELADVLRRCDLLISADSGPVHVAAAVATPVVGIYSARHYPGCWYPCGDNHIVIRKDLPCQACFLTDCPSPACMAEISPEEVTRACWRILARARPNSIQENAKPPAGRGR